ncbi:MAG: DUF721 domain-containing protein [Hyphomicrobiales bacterium]|nr:DUF721 domain-containing protein [Hyphomicrobiales bacterium]
MAKNREQSPPPNRFLGFRAVAEAVVPIVQPAVAKRGLGAERLLERWPEVIGAHLSRQIWPERLAFPRGRRQDGVLHLRVSSGAAAIEVQHLEPVIVERINSIFGYRAVTRLRLTHGRLPHPHAAELTPPPPEQPPALAPDVEDTLSKELQSVEDDDLRLALQKLGRAVFSQSSSR